MDSKERAILLKKEYEKEYQFYSKPLKRGFIARCRNLAKKLNENSHFEIMVLDMLSMRIGTEIFL